MRKGVIYLFILLLGAAQLSFAAGSESAKSTLDRLIGLFKSYKRAPEGQMLSEAELEENRRVTGEVRRIFDYETLINEALVDQRGVLNGAQRERIFRLFKELIELLALPQGSYFYNSSESTFLEPLIDGAQVTIPSTNFNRDRDIEVNMDYVFRKRGESWMMVDIILNGHSLVQNYRRQINRVVKKKGVDGLLETLEQKYKAAQEGR